MDDFDKAIEFIFKWEGYRSEHPSDPGGLTIWGISKRAHPKVVEKMENMDKEAARKFAKQFYKENYWQVVSMDIPWPVNVVAFDTAIQFGNNDAVKMLQSAFNRVFKSKKSLKVDGLLGQKTKEAVQNLTEDNLKLLALSMLLERLDWYNNSKVWKVFGLGWTNRLIDLYHSITASKGWV